MFVLNIYLQRLNFANKYLMKIIQKKWRIFIMWIGVQIIIFISLISISLILPKNLYLILISIGVIFTVFAVFANWLLVIQIFNILGSGGLGLKIIETRDSFLKTIYIKVMRIGKDTKRFRIPKDSKIPVISLICSIMIILLHFWSFDIIDGEFRSTLITPFQFFKYYNFIDVLRYISFLGDVLLLYFSYNYTKKNIEVFVIPAIIRVVCLVIYDLYYFIRMMYWGIMYWEIIIQDLFLAISYISIFTMVLLVLNNIIKSKIPTVIACLIPIGVAISLCVQHKPPFIYSDGAIALSSIISFIAYCVGYAALAYSLDNKPEKQYY